MPKAKSISAYQFSVFRVIFAAYLICYFISLNLEGGELLSRITNYAGTELSAFPNPLLGPVLTQTGMQFFLLALIICSFFVLTGFHRRLSSWLVCYGFLCLIKSNAITLNVGILQVCLILLSLVLIPSGEPLSRTNNKDKHTWYFPFKIYLFCWLLLAIAYAVSGLTTLASFSWLDTDIRIQLVTNPLAQAGGVHDIFLKLPPLIVSSASYLYLTAEILFLPLSMRHSTRYFAWCWMFVMQLCVLCLAQSANLTLAMLMMHLFLFDPSWLPARINKTGKIIVFFDGVCGLCNRSINLLLDEDRSQILKFSPLQGKTAKQFISGELESIIVVDSYKTNQQEVLRASSAVFRALDAIGGFWRVVALLRFLPLPIRDWGYFIIANNRYPWFGKSAECRIITPEVRGRFLE